MTFNLNPYIKLARLDKPTGIWLLLLPCWWGLFLTKPSTIPFTEIFLFSLGAVFLRGAGCTYNDIVDRTYDAQVHRTSSRPLARGTITVNQAVVFLILQLIAGFFVLMSFPSLTIQLSVSSLLLVGIYPWMKRFTYWPQVFLGLAFNWGALVGWTSLTSTFSLAPIFLYLGGICWTLGYDTIYAHQDIEDDMRIGVKSSAIALKQHTWSFLGLTYALMLIFFVLAGLLQNLSWLYYIGLVVLSFHLAWQVLTLDIYDPEDCMTKFKSNILTGFLALTALICGSF
jgi:4-hydroxybenzoate polyprenyltransferase